MNHSLALSIGLPGQGLHFGLDPLSIFFLCLLAPSCVAAAIGGAARGARFWLLLAGMVMTVAGRDAFTLLLGFGVAQGVLWLPLPRRGPGWPAGYALFSLVGFTAVAFLPAGGLAFCLILLALGGLCGLALFHAPLNAAHRNETALGSFVVGGLPVFGFYLLIRYAFIVLSQGAAPWWGVVLLLLGAVSAGWGVWQAAQATALRQIAAGASLAQSGLTAIALGIALLGRLWGDPLLAALALQAGFFLIAVQALLPPLLMIAANMVLDATGTESLDWLGGLMRGMPKLGLLASLGIAGLAFLPPGPGFAALFLLLHAVMAAAAGENAVARIGFTALLVLLGCVAALSVGNAVRVVGMGFLGRPRSLRAAAAEEAPRQVLIALGVLAVCAALLGLFPGLALLLLRPVITLAMPNAILPPFDYEPLTLILIVALPAGILFLAVRRFGVRGEREARAWNGGLGKPPAWLPFGDPLTQASATGFAAPLGGLMPRLRGGGMPKRWVRRMLRLTLAVPKPGPGSHLAIFAGVLVLALLVAGLELPG